MRPLRIGQFNSLKVLASVRDGFELESGVWLASRETREDVYAGRTLEVFLYRGSKGELLATQFVPHVCVGEIGRLQVTAVQEKGAFLDWGLHKELFLPLMEQTRKLQVGDKVSIHVFLDKEERLTASMKVESFLDRETPPYREGDEVDLYILRKTPLGYTAVIDNRTTGLIFQNEVFQTLREGQRLPGFISRVREDGKINLVLQKPGYQHCDPTAEKILRELEHAGGRLKVGDKTSPEEIYSLFGVSKKKFKMALGSLYKKRLVKLGYNSIERA